MKTIFLIVKALVGNFNMEEALVGPSKRTVKISRRFVDSSSHLVT